MSRARSLGVYGLAILIGALAAGAAGLITLFALLLIDLYVTGHGGRSIMGGLANALFLVVVAAAGVLAGVTVLRSNRPEIAVVDRARER